MFDASRLRRLNCFLYAHAYTQKASHCRADVPTLRPARFNNAAWLFEPKYDGFRGIVYLTGGRCTIYSKRGNRFSRFSELEKRLCGAFLKRGAILDGEVMAFDADGRVSFWHLMRGEGTLGYVAFDLLWSRALDLRALPLVEGLRACPKLPRCRPQQMEQV
jgi:bifunctional non-homologous end joining protein LigD